MNKTRDPERRLKLWIARLIQDSADFLAEIQQLEQQNAELRAQLAAGNREALQTAGGHPRPCARFCEAPAYGIELRTLRRQLAETGSHDQPEDERRGKSLLCLVRTMRALGRSYATIGQRVSENLVLWDAQDAARAKADATSEPREQVFPCSQGGMPTYTADPADQALCLSCLPVEEVRG